jgi:hypothetical protein
MFTHAEHADVHFVGGTHDLGGIKGVREPCYLGQPLDRLTTTRLLSSSSTTAAAESAEVRSPASFRARRDRPGAEGLADSCQPYGGQPCQHPADLTDGRIHELIPPAFSLLPRHQRVTGRTLNLTVTAP